MDETGFGPAMMLSHSQKLEDDILSAGLRIKHYEDSIAFLQGRIQLADDAVRGMQVTLRRYEASSSRGRQNENDEYNDKVFKQIISAPDSAAALVFQLKRQQHSPTWIKDVVGIVASLATVESDSQSRILSEYLGEETMLAVVCKTQACVRDLDAYKKGLEGLGACLGSPGRSAVICLEKMRPYAGEFLANDPQRRLDLLHPRLPNGETPAGFVGFAVNMIHIHEHGVGLRQTLFWKLFSRLQVYQTKADMLQALPLLVDGAVSLDGAILRGSDILCLGKPAEAGLRFPKSSKQCILPEVYYRAVKSMKEEKWEREWLVEDMQREVGLLNQAKAKYEEKKQEFIKLLAQMRSSHAAFQLSQSLGRLAHFKKDKLES